LDLLLDVYYLKFYLKRVNNFLPEDYKVPTSKNGYMTLEQGDNKFRIMSSAIIGYEYWIDIDIEGKSVSKPVRIPMDSKDKIPVRFADKVRHFWAMLVYNYNTKQFQILQLRQRGLQLHIAKLARMKEWGDPRKYDYVINREGEGYETRYQITASPPSEFSKKLMEEYEELDIKLEALFATKEYPNGGNPFEAMEENVAEEPEDAEVVTPDDLPF
jgi:hypothetical protein